MRAGLKNFWAMQANASARARSLNLNSELEQVVLLLVLIVAPKLFIEPGAKAKVVNAFERERPPDCE